MNNWLTTGTEWLRHRMLSSLLTAGATVVGLEFITRGIFDFFLDLVLLGLIFAAGKLAKGKR